MSAFLVTSFRHVPEISGTIKLNFQTSPFSDDLHIWYLLFDVVELDSIAKAICSMFYSIIHSLVWEYGLHFLSKGETYTFEQGAQDSGGHEQTGVNGKRESKSREG